MWGGVAASAGYLVKCCLNVFVYRTQPPVVVLVNALELALVVCFKVFRYHYRTNTKFHEYIVLTIVGIPSILCLITNLDLLPKKLDGPGLDDFRYDFFGKFFILFLFSLVNFDKVIFFVGPLYLISQFFYL